MEERKVCSKSKVVLILVARVLSYPEDDNRKHERNTLGDVGVAVVGELL